MSPALKVLAVAALPISNRRMRKRILADIRNTSGQLADAGSVRDAEDAVSDARAQADAEGSENLNRLDGAVHLPAYRRGLGPFRVSYRALAKLSSERGYERRILDALNDTLQSIGRPEV